MDLWDVVKLMGRRWYVALPMLVLTMAAALLTALTVKPDYTTTTNVSLLPPILVSDRPTEPTQTVNPWDTGSLTMATLTYLNSKRLHDQMKGEGFSPVWEADIDERLRSLMVIKVTAPTPDLSQATARKLQDVIAEEVARRQAKYNLKPGEQFTTIPFDDGDNVEAANRKVKRALIVVAGVGLIVTIAFTVGLDAFMRWRSARGSERQLGVGRQNAVDGAATARIGQPATTAQASTDGQSSSRTAQPAAGIPQPPSAPVASTAATTQLTASTEMLATDDAIVVLPLPDAAWRNTIENVGDKTAENGMR